MVLASGELFSWGELAPYLIEINKATRLRLLVFVATCFGSDIATLVRPRERAPARVLIGPRETISINTLERGTFAFYRSLRSGDGTQAVIDMNLDSLQANASPAAEDNACRRRSGIRSLALADLSDLEGRRSRAPGSLHGDRGIVELPHTPRPTALHAAADRRAVRAITFPSAHARSRTAH